MAKDPVCGMAVEEEKAAAKAEHMGKTYYFCSRGCKAAFDRDPKKYVGMEGEMGHEGMGHGCH